LRVGIPRSLAYYDYYPLWETFFQHLGCEVVTSPATTPSIASQGIAVAGDDVCYPVKLMHGHVAELADKVDVIFVPRLFSTLAGTCECPKLIGMADMLRHSISSLPPLLSPYVNLRLGKRGLLKAIFAAGGVVTRNPWRIYRAFLAGQQALMALKRRFETGRFPGQSSPQRGDKGALAVIGHPYNLYDSYANLRVIERLLQQGYLVLTPQMLPNKSLEKANAQLRKPLFWSSGRVVFGAGAHFATRPDVIGIIHLASFGCGLESLIVDMVQRIAVKNDKPYLLLTMDEHTGEAGVETRLEAFLDMIAWKEAANCG
jgi:predicted nucleotide-binding protein (sugar kinase/HSP70/actin superfamily)